MKVLLTCLGILAFTLAAEAGDLKVKVQPGNTACPYPYSFFDPGQSSYSATLAPPANTPAFFYAPVPYYHGLWRPDVFYVFPIVTTFYPSSCRSAFHQGSWIIYIR